MSIYLDIETNWDGDITVVGFYHEITGLVQLVAPEITQEKLQDSLPESASRIVTYNGNCFDLRVIKHQFGINFREKYESCDLRWVCQSAGITGGLKAVERRLGISRETEGINGKDALVLWENHRRGSSKDLDLLLKYNKEDVMNLIGIEKKLKERNILV